MAFFVLNSRITIQSSVKDVGKVQFSGVHEVRIKKSIHSVIETATLTIPSIAKYIPKNKSVPITVTTGTQFSDGDPISIELGYNGDYRTEFVGFVKRRSMGMPLVVECEGYCRVLRLGICINADYTKKHTSAKDLLNLIAANAKTDDGQSAGLKVQCDVDFPLCGIKLVNADGVHICDYIKEASDHTLTIFFINPTTLWCGLTYTAYSKQSTANAFNLPTVSYRIGYNTPKDNTLKERIPSEPVTIVMKGKTPAGILLATNVQVQTAANQKYAARKMQTLVNHVPDNNTLSKFAYEKAYNMNYTGLEGSLTGFLQPFALPGYDALITDKRYPDLKGTYLIESTDVTFGVRGARRVCEIGPRVGFGNLNIN